MSDTMNITTIEQIEAENSKEFKVWCFHHNDLDGHCGGAVVKYFKPEAQMVEMAYGYKPEVIFDVVNENDEVIFVDFSPSVEDMQKLVHQMNCEVVWLDHHITAIENLKEYDFLKGLRDDTKAGCELAWEYYAEKMQPTAPEGVEYKEPFIVHLLGRYDVWDHADHNAILAHYGMSLFETAPSSEDSMEMWKELFEDNGEWDAENPFSCPPTRHVLSLGEIIWTYRMQHAQYLMKHTCEMEWEGYRWLVLNGFTEDSYTFDSKFDSEKHDGTMWFYWSPKNGTWKFSLRSPKVDLTAIARKYDGGGHAGAVGFMSKDLPFELPVVVREKK